MGTSKFQVTKSVCLNEKNEDDLKILKHTSRRNFSGYVKKLILQDIKRKQEQKQRREEPQPHQEDKKQPSVSAGVPVDPVVPVVRPSVLGRNRSKVERSVLASPPLIKQQNQKP